MNFTVKNYNRIKIISLQNGRFITGDPLTVTLVDNRGRIYTIRISAGTVWNGLSIPKVFRWFLPVYDETNYLYNIAGLIHDLLYASSLLPKDTADDIFRGILRDAGISRFKASTAELCVEKFAGKHYGSDEYGMKDHISVN